jgi:N-acetylmuramoyl-L-alanine amidase
MRHVAPSRLTRRRLWVGAVLAAVIVASLVFVVVRSADDRVQRSQTTASSAATTATTAPVTTLAPTTTTTSTLPATTVAAPVPTTVPAAVMAPVFVIDPGHNEHNAQHTREIHQQVDVVTQHKDCDTTGTETDDGYAEAAFTTDVANRVADLLRAQGATVVLTRDPSTAWGPCVTERAAIGNEAHADAAISIHADGGPPDGHGFHVIGPLPIRGHNEDIVAPSRQLALDVRGAYRDATGLPFSTYAGDSGLDFRDDLGGLNLSTVPKVFIECGNMRNANDAYQLESAAFRQRIAEGIANGLLRFVGR